MGASSTEGCSICDRITGALEQGQAIYDDDHWVVLPSTDRPGWSILAARRHCEWAWGMDDAARSTYGHALAEVTGAIRDAVGSDKVYVVGFGEGAIHFHVLLIPGIKGLNDAWRSAMSEFGAPFNDAAAAADARAQIRKQLQS